MAKKNISRDRDEYTRYLGAFRGVDFSSDPSEVEDYRLSNSVNMYKDYRSGQGHALETIPGFRLAQKLDGKIYGLHQYTVDGKSTFIVHAGKKLYKAPDLDFPDNAGNTITWKLIYSDMAEAKSESFLFNNRIYFLDGKSYLYFDGNTVVDVTSDAYAPVTHISLRPDGSKYEEVKSSGEYRQQNILSSMYGATYVADGESATFTLPLGSDYFIKDDEKPPSSRRKWEIESAVGMSNIEVYEAEFPDESELAVYQYGVRLPWAGPKGEIPYFIDTREQTDETVNKVPEGYAWSYPNAIKSITAPGVVELVKAPPIPEKNTCKPNSEKTSGFEYAWNSRYPAGYAGIEISALKTIKTIKGITSSVDKVGGIISGCRICTVYDGRVFLSGNPDYPNIVFYSGINDTGYNDPSYFGVLDWFSEGVTNTPITGLMPIADTLMVLRRDTVQDGSVTFRTPVSTGGEVVSVIYQGTAGLPGTGCLGAFCNFRDDPTFISKYGLEAMGQLSARYERSVEHRSYLIDGLLLNKDLSRACMTEFESYLVILINGEIFLADSRQMYTHSSGVIQYEWYYLNDIGIYEGQKREAIYIDVPEEYKGQTIINDYNGLEYVIASIDDLYRDERDYVSQLGNKIVEQYSHGTTDDDTSFACVIRTVGDIKYAVPVKILDSYGGGTFCPATLIKALDNEHLIFGTDEGHIACFNFDKRDPNNDYKIPNQWYTFNNRTIRSALVTKMDNCGIPHLTKSTVKKSMVVKMRTFPISSAKISVRTNRQGIVDVEKLVNGRFGFDGLDFSQLTYETGDKNLFRVREKEKKWVEKQLYISSEEFKQPFSLYYISYGYYIAGRYKD